MSTPDKMPIELIANQLTVVMPHRNHGQYVAEALRAIFNQSHQPNRVVIIDDASDDNSLEVIRSIQKEHPELELICNEIRMGVLKICNQWLASIDTEFLYFAAADDILLPEYFKSTIDLLRAYPEAPVCSAFTHHIDSEGAEIKITDPVLKSSEPHFIKPDDALDMFCRYGNFLPGNTSLHRTAALLSVGGFAEDLNAFGDGYALTVAAVKHGICLVPKRLATQRHLHSGIAKTMVRDVEGSLETLNKTLNHMTTDFPDLFPVRFLRRFEARWRYGLALVALLSDETQNDLLQAMAPVTALDKIVFKIIRLLGKPDGKLTRRLLWARMCPFDILPAFKNWAGRAIKLF